MFIQTVPEVEAEGALAEIYRRDRERWGFLPGFTRLFSLHPDAYQGWLQLITAIRGQMDLRRCELATLAAARVLRSNYCTVAHGKILRDRFLGAETVRRAVQDHHDAGLDEVEVAVMDFAAQVARNATSVTAADVERLKALGLSDRDVLDVVLTVAARCFFATVLEALGASPDPELVNPLEPELREALLVNRPNPA